MRSFESSSMEKLNDGKPDDLEIISIGTIYSGSWDKKYWSSSRGKDRYPYPVGYQAIRTHNGTLYTMEIRQGRKGPLFVINSSDGDSCSGQTPDIAWEGFQKNGCSRMKVSHGKRSSRRLDGVELFGFKNPFVQRLLRELVADINGTGQQSCLSSRLCNGASRADHNAQCLESCPYTDLLLYLEGPRHTRKRSRPFRSRSVMQDCEPEVKRFQNLDPSCSADASNCRRNVNNQNDENPMISSTFVGNHVTSEHLQVVSQSVGLVASEEGIATSSSSQHALNCESQNSDSNKKESLLQDKSTLFPPKGCGKIENSPTYEEPICRPQDSEASKVNLLTGTKVEDGKAPATKICSGITHVGLCAPDTLEPLQEDTSDFAAVCPRESPENVDDSVVPEEDLVTKLHSNEGNCTSASNATSENCDFDSEGQDIAKSMMTFLLPQALPLLKFSRKKKIVKSAESFQLKVDSVEKNNQNDLLASAAFVAVKDSKPGGHKKLDTINLDPASVLPEFEHIKSVVPDSFENDKCMPAPDSLVLLDSVDPVENLAAGCFETCRGKENSDQDIHAAPSCTPLKADASVSESDLGCSSPNLKTFTRRSKTTGINCKRSSRSIKTSTKTEANWRSDAENSLNSDGNKMVEDKNIKSNSTVQNSQKADEVLYGNNIPDAVEGQVDLLQPQLELHRDMELSNELKGMIDLVGCYAHPMRVSSLLVTAAGDEIFFCVLCGNLVDRDRTLFLYKVPFRQQRAGCPSIVGHAPVVLPVEKDSLGRENMMERSYLQFTPNGQYLIFVNKIKMPFCREQNIDCSCPACPLNSYEGGAVNIVQVEVGYVSVVANLKTDSSVHCILVCGPQHLVSLEETGKLHVWAMNALWSAQEEDFVLPTYDLIVEVKKIPRFNHLIVGHNGFGEFGLWDITKCTVISRFSAPDTFIVDILPISLFSWSRTVSASSSLEVEEYVDSIMVATKNWFSDQGKNYAHVPLEREDMAVWLLVSTVTSHTRQYSQASDCNTNRAEWKLALLMKNMVILGSSLDPRATTVGASVDHGIIGTVDGLVYISEVLSGLKLGILHSFEGHAVSCIAVDDSRPNIIAIASEGKMLVYIHSHRDFANVSSEENSPKELHL